MAYFDDPAKAREYLEIAADYSGRELVELVQRLVQPGADVLELGMGPGRDLDLLLAAGLQAVGSDSAQPFLDFYQERSGKAETLLLDAVTLQTSRSFDVVYSNKVLQHLSEEQLDCSLRRQADLLRPGGLLVHSLWYGSERQQIEDLLFVQYTEQSFGLRVPAALRVVDTGRYGEDEAGDSLWVVLERSDEED